MFIQMPTPEPIAVIQVVLQQNTLLEIATLVLLPVITFFLGLLSSIWIQQRAEKSNTKNLKSILFKEMKENYKYLNGAIPREDGDDPEPDAGSYIASYLSTSVYDAYLNRLGSLKAEIVDEVFDAYQFVRVLINNAEFLKYWRTGCKGCPAYMPGLSISLITPARCTSTTSLATFT